MIRNLCKMRRLSRFTAQPQPRFLMQQNFMASNAMLHNMRHFSSQQPKKDDYESGFEDLLNKGKVSESEKQEMKEKLKAKEDASKQKAEDLEKAREKDYQQKEQAFEDFLDGKTPKKQGITDDMTLQDIFKQAYGRAKDIDIGPGKIVNSARSSLNSFSSRLEKRRKAAAEAKANEEVK